MIDPRVARPLSSIGLVVLVGCIDFGSVRVFEPDAAIEVVDAASLSDASALDAAALLPDAAALLPDAAAPCVPGRVDPATAGIEIRIVRFSVETNPLVVNAGEVVVWTNADSMNHRLVSGEPGTPITRGPGAFNTGSLATGRSYAHRFCEPIRLTYYCSAHPSQMRGFVLDIR